MILLIMQVYVDFFSITILLLGGALACYGEQQHFNSHFVFSISVSACYLFLSLVLWLSAPSLLCIIVSELKISLSATELFQFQN